MPAPSPQTDTTRHSPGMTDEEVLACADAIRARRKNAITAHKLMRCPQIKLVGYDAKIDPLDPVVEIDIKPTPELAVFLCRELDCDLPDPATKGDEA